MNGELVAHSHPAGRRIELGWAFDRPLPMAGVTPRLCLVQSRRGNPADPTDGLVVLEVEELFQSPGLAWGRIERTTYLTTNPGLGNGVAEATVTLFFAAPADAEPELARVAVFDALGGADVVDVVQECSRVVRSDVPLAGWNHHQLIEIFHTPGGNPEVSAGVLELFRESTTLGAADHLVWTPAGGTPRAADFDEERSTRVTLVPDSTIAYDVSLTAAGPVLPWVRATRVADPDQGVERWTFSFSDRGLAPITTYHYGLFDRAATIPRLSVAHALATEDYGSPKALFHRLPAAYQRLDEPDPTTPIGAAGPLRRLLAPLGNAIDLGRSHAESARTRHDVFSVRADLLPHLARLIAWPSDLTAQQDRQREDLLHAPELYGTVGTARNVRTLVDRVTGWPVQIKEFVHNVFLTNAPEAQSLWELWANRHDGVAWDAPATLTLTTAADGRPALAVDGGGVIWAFWHSDRNGIRQVWLQRLGGVDPAPVLARAGTPDDVPGTMPLEEDPAAVFDGTSVRLFWSSDEGEQRDLWTRSFAAGPPADAAMRLTDHPAPDHSPAAAVVPGAPARLWLFWSSTRRGPADIWCQSQDLVTTQWTPPERLTTSPLRDDRPAAAVDTAGNLWLFWTRDAGGGQSLWHQVFDGTTWSSAAPIVTGHARDASPAAVPWKGHVLLLWHSDHAGAWQLWAAFHDGTQWLPPVRLNDDVQGDKEPAVAIDAGGALRLVWRSQRRAMWYRSQTIDTEDTEMLEALGTIEDHAHYTYHTGTGDHDWYARDAVGVFVDTDADDPLAVPGMLERARRFVEPFQPLQARLAWVPDGIVHVETLSPDVSIADEWVDELT
jgi:hypothetical protein